MPFGRLTTAGRISGSALCGALFIPLTLSATTARADVYHAVAVGESLSSVASKYQVPVDTLRAANGLKDIPEATPLGSMLLRIPSAKESKSTLNLPSNMLAGSSAGFGGATSAPEKPNAFGSIGRSVEETVRKGDTWETIAARYRQAGNDVSVDALRRRNNYAEAPLPGQTVLVPLGQIAYSAPATTASPVSSPRYAPRTSITASAQTNPFTSQESVPVPTVSTAPQQPTSKSLDGGVTASPEVDLPYARSIESAAPVYRAPNSSTVMNRGNLPSRGGFGEMTRRANGGEVRVLKDNEEANTPPTQQLRGAQDKSSRIAKVAKVASHGAQIRRLPQASAVSLYSCPVGTQLAVLEQRTGWCAILMSDRSTGWIPSKYLQGTGQTVDISTQIVTSQGAGGSVGYTGNYGRENPMVARALTWLGTPYRYGGTGRRGIDCSALVQTSFRDCGYRLPRTAAQQATVGAAVEPANLRSGDRLYFSASGTRIDHTGLYMGNGLFVHASGSGRQVMVSNLFEPRNWNIFVGARR